MVDAYGTLQGQAAGVREAYAAVRLARAELADEEARIAKARADADYLRHAHAELTKLSPQPGEDEELAARRISMMQAEKVTAELRDTNDLMSGDHSPMSALSSAMRRLERRAAQAPALIEPSVKALDAALTALDLAQQAIDQALRDADFDPRDLEMVEERLFALRAASRKYAVGVDALPALAEKFSADLQALDAGEARLIALAKASDAAAKTYDKLAKDLSAARAKAAAGLGKEVNAELAPLKLERATFITHIESCLLYTSRCV